MKSSAGVCSPFVLLLALFAGLALPRFAWAQQSEPRVVVVEVIGSPAVVRAARETTTEVLGRLDVEPRVDAEGRVPVTSPPWIRAYLDLSNLRTPRLVVLEGATQRELARRTLSGSASVETGIESATLVLYMLLESLLSAELERSVPRSGDGRSGDGRSGDGRSGDGRSGDGRSANGRSGDRASAGQSSATRQADAPARSSALEQGDEMSAFSGRAFESPPAIRLHAGALLRMTMLDDARGVAGGGLLAGVRAERLGAVLFASVHFPAELSSNDAAAAVTVFSSRLLLTIDAPIAARSSSVFGAGGGVDWFTANVSRTPPGSVASSSVSTLHGVLTALLGLRVAVAEPILLTTAVALDFDASPRTFTGTVGEERRPLLQLARLRPSVLISVAFSSGGERASRASRTSRWSARGGRE